MNPGAAQLAVLPVRPSKAAAAAAVGGEVAAASTAATAKCLRPFARAVATKLASPSSRAVTVPCIATTASVRSPVVAAVAVAAVAAVVAATAGSLTQTHNETAGIASAVHRCLVASGAM